MKAQTQKGHLTKKNNAWIVRWRELEKHSDGKIVKVNRSQKIASVRDYPQKREVWPLYLEFMSRLNAAGFDFSSCMTVQEFVRDRYFTWAKANLATSTTMNYRQVWQQRLEDRIGFMRVRDVRPMHIENVLVSIVRTNPELSSRTVQRAKALLSGICTRAVAAGLIDRNPVREVTLPKTKKKASEMYAYTTEEVLQILDALPPRAKAVCAVAAYAGLTVSEIRGLQWSDYDVDSNLLFVRRAVWRTTVGETKALARQRPVPVIAPLRAILDGYRASLPFISDWMFESAAGTPLDLGDLDDRVIIPALDRCFLCGTARGKHECVTHAFEPRSPRLEWYGYHAFRRSLATRLYSLGIPELVIQRILRHKPGSSVTREHYIRAVGGDVRTAMDRFEESLCGSPSVPQTQVVIPPPPLSC
jgi:integrase